MASILLVDDDSSMLHFLKVALERAGHQVVTCNDGQSALRCLKESDSDMFELLLTDIVMPGMDGIQLSQQAKDLIPELKIMFMTGFSAMVMDRADMREKNNIVSKPFHLKDLVREVEQLLAA